MQFKSAPSRNSVAGPNRLVPLAALVGTGITEGALRTAANRGRLRAQKAQDGRWRSTKAWVDDYVGAIVAWTAFADAVTAREVVSLVIAAVGVSFVLRSGHEHDHRHGPVEHDHEHVHPDEYHVHDHAAGIDVPAGAAVRHQHPNRHELLVHAHPHVPDLHHRHDHAHL